MSYTDEAISSAILKAADSIEQNPDMFCYMKGRVSNCGEPMCVFAWIGYHLGERNGRDWYTVAKDFIGLDSASAIDWLMPYSTFITADLHDSKAENHPDERYNLNAVFKAHAPTALRRLVAAVNA